MCRQVEPWGGLTEVRDEIGEPSGGVEQQRSTRSVANGEAMRHVAWEEHERPRCGVPALVPTVNDEFAVDEIEDLVLALMHVAGWGVAGCYSVLDDVEATGRACAADLVDG